MKKQTAIDWLEEYISKEINKYKMQPMDLHAIYALNHIKEFACSKAKEMEKQRMLEFADKYGTYLLQGGTMSATTYNETFKSE
jgi:hypothetical protein